MMDKIINFIFSSSFGFLIFIVIMSIIVRIETCNSLVELIEIYSAYTISFWFMRRFDKELEEIENENFR